MSSESRRVAAPRQPAGTPALQNFHYAQLTGQARLQVGSQVQ
jgi:hypothetical protein